MEQDAPSRPSAPRVGIAFNLKRTQDESQAEFDEPQTIEAIASAIEGVGYETVLLEADAEFPAKLAANPVDIVFNIAEGSRGRSREAQVPAILEYMGIPYTGSDASAMCVALDKALAKKVFEWHGIRTPRFEVIEADSGKRSSDILPAIVKPNAEGSSKGISNDSVAFTNDELSALVARNLDAFGEDLLVEEYIPGREFTVGILGNGNEQVVFPPMEIIYREHSKADVYSLETKHDFRKHIDYKCPADISPELSKELMVMAKKAHEALGCNDMSRSDFRVSPDGEAYLIEMNPLPGLEPGYSDYPMLAGFCGVEYPLLIRAILETALARQGIDCAKGVASPMPRGGRLHDES